MTDAAEQVVAASVDLAALRDLAAWATVPVGTDYRRVDMAEGDCEMCEARKELVR